MNMNRTQIFFLAAAVLTSAVTSSGCIAQSGSASRPTAAPNQANSMAFTIDPATAHPGLLDPSKAKFTAPNEPFYAKFETTKGDFVLEVNREWAPKAADRFYSMVKVGFFHNTAIFRAIDSFMFQFGVHGVPEVANAWANTPITDDQPAGKSNVPGTISFAQTPNPNSRSSQMFINLGNNGRLLDQQRSGPGFYPFGKIVKGMDVIKKINTEYDENKREDDVQGNFKKGGNAYIEKKFPNIDYIKRVTLVPNPMGAGNAMKDGSGMKAPAVSPVTGGSGAK